MHNNEPTCLLLQLYGPMQSWGISSRWSERDTLLEPSKSGIVGLISAALGRTRDKPVDDLASLRMGVRVDLAGVPSVDFQTAGAGDTSAGIAKAVDKEPNVKDRWAILDGTRRTERKGSSISNRYHLQDAAFLVALQSNDVELLQYLDAALRTPVFPIGLGRRGYVPSIPVAMPHNHGVMSGNIDTLFRSIPWLPHQKHFHINKLSWRRQDQLRTVIETTGSDAHATRMDQPIGAAFATRQFGPRGVVFGEVPLAPPKEIRSDDQH